MDKRKPTIYQKTPILQDESFRNPSSEYRGAPFWAWNGDMKEDILFEQIECLKKMGFGGAHMHIRTGMAQKFLGEEHLNLVKSCTAGLKENNMLAWLYDEDRWPSGFAGGYVTKDIKNRKKGLRLTRSRAPEDEYRALLAVYDIELDEEGFLAYYSRISEDSSARGNKWYAYLETDREAEAWFGNQTYVDTLDKDAIRSFIGFSHERFYRAVGDEFGKSIPAIFTDEPQYRKAFNLESSFDNGDILYPWTTKLADYYKDTYDLDILEHIPELFWELPDKRISAARYHFYDCLAELFVTAYADTVGDWCSEHGIMLTGHINYEGLLFGQTFVVGEAMRSYRSFGIPGVDMLCHNFEYATAKQCQSAVHQYGRAAMLAEEYGVTNYDFDFRGYKNQGDWLAALGATVRVPHLSLYSMAGEAKRDYPASIFFQAPWHERYEYLESHYARINTAMTRGRPLVKVGVIHPIESYWLHYAAKDKTGDICRDIENKFQNVIRWLLFSDIDFDFISESLLPSLCEAGSNPLQVGEMAYDVIVVPECETLRKSTLVRLEKFRAEGGEIIFMGRAPALCDAVPSDRALRLYEKSTALAYEAGALCESLESYRTLSIEGANGKNTENLIYQMREEEDGTRWLFIANGKNCFRDNLPHRNDIVIRLRGSYAPTLYETLTGNIKRIPFECKGGETLIPFTVYQNDSLLFKLSPTAECALSAEKKEREMIPIRLQEKNSFALSEDNVMVLDMAEYRLNDGEWNEREEILRLDNACRKLLGWSEMTGLDAQPWIRPRKAIENFVTLRFEIESEIYVPTPSLALENLDMAQIKLNGDDVKNEAAGYYIDRCLGVVRLPSLNKGMNILEVRLPIGGDISVEDLFLLGDFGVSVSGMSKRLVKLPEKLAFGDIRGQGLDFYSANVAYSCDIDIPCAGDMHITVPEYNGALVGVRLDGEDMGNIAFAPYELVLSDVTEGKHTLQLCLYGNRFNTLGQIHYNHEIFTKLHDYDEMPWYGPKSFRTTGEMWSYEYKTKPMGILKTPICLLEK